ncbi:MAG: hypothetical protein HY741_04765 [Chloroflexi bacterium]|nr:hypothetical protein [Chloroflexota bacterium]
MEAGLEHLSRAGGTLRHVDQLLIVTEMDRKALATARKTFFLAQELGVTRVGLVGNKVRDAAEENELEKFSGEIGIELAAMIPFDEAARQADRRGAALYDYDPNAATVKTLEQVVTRFEKQFELAPAQQPRHTDTDTVTR